MPGRPWRGCRRDRRGCRSSFPACGRPARRSPPRLTSDAAGKLDDPTIAEGIAVLATSDLWSIHARLHVDEALWKLPVLIGDLRDRMDHRPGGGAPSDSGAVARTAARALVVRLAKPSWTTTPRSRSAATRRARPRAGRSRRRLAAPSSSTLWRRLTPARQRVEVSHDFRTSRAPPRSGGRRGRRRAARGSASRGSSPGS